MNSEKLCDYQLNAHTDIHTCNSQSKFIPVAQVQPLRWKSALDSLSASRVCSKKIFSSKIPFKFCISVSISNSSHRKYSFLHMNVISKKLPEAELLINSYTKYEIIEETKFKCTVLL